MKLSNTTHPLVVEKDKSIHSVHGIIHYPFYFGGLASCVSNVCTQPLGVRKFIPILVK
jgi:solute carrier family 25 (mitochondrial dicarboxylate transporter), member 10